MRSSQAPWSRGRWRPPKSQRLRVRRGGREVHSFRPRPRRWAGSSSTGAVTRSTRSGGTETARAPAPDRAPRCGGRTLRTPSRSAGAAVNASRPVTTRRAEGRTLVTYNRYPLCTFVKDTRRIRPTARAGTRSAGGGTRCRPPEFHGSVTCGGHAGRSESRIDAPVTCVWPDSRLATAASVRPGSGRLHSNMQRTRPDNDARRCRVSRDAAVERVCPTDCWRRQCGSPALRTSVEPPRWCGTWLPRRARCPGGRDYLSCRDQCSADTSVSASSNVARYALKSTWRLTA